jgi:hypothetical protein
LRQVTIDGELIWQSCASDQGPQHRQRSVQPTRTAMTVAASKGNRPTTPQTSDSTESTIDDRTGHRYVSGQPTLASGARACE